MKYNIIDLIVDTNINENYKINLIRFISLQ